MVTLYNCFSFNEEWYLVEMALTVAPKNIKFDEIVVPEESVKEDSWQTAFAEQFLNYNGTQRICSLYEMPADGDSTSRIAFFIFKTGSHNLKTPYGSFKLSGLNEVPDRLKSIVEFDCDDI